MDWEIKIKYLDSEKKIDITVAKKVNGDIEIYYTEQDDFSSGFIKLLFKGALVASFRLDGELKKFNCECGDETLRLDTKKRCIYLSLHLMEFLENQFCDN